MERSGTRFRDRHSMLITVTVVIVKEPRVPLLAPGWILKGSKFDGQPLSHANMNPPNSYGGDSAPIVVRH